MWQGQGGDVEAGEGDVARPPRVLGKGQEVSRVRWTSLVLPGKPTLPSVPHTQATSGSVPPSAVPPAWNPHVLPCLGPIADLQRHPSIWCGSDPAGSQAKLRSASVSGGQEVGT